MTKIEWTHREGTTGVAWNPVTGCTPVSEGCAHCYAARMAKRLAGRCGYPAAPHEFDVTLHPDKLNVPLHWRKPRTVFVCSMSDLFHEDVSDDYIYRVFLRMAECNAHTFIVLTKRAERMAEWMDTNWPYLRQAWSMQNIWGLVTVENQQHANERIPHLLRCPFTVRGVSYEPALGPVDFGLAPLDWLICGGESGPGARPMHPDWARQARDWCKVARVPFFFKQWGAWQFFHTAPDGKPIYERVGKTRAGHLLDGKEHHEWPSD